MCVCRGAYLLGSIFFRSLKSIVMCLIICEYMVDLCSLESSGSGLFSRPKNQCS